MGAMKSKAEKVLVVESDEALREQVVAVLSDAGYEMSTEYAEGMKAFGESVVRVQEFKGASRVLCKRATPFVTHPW